MARTTAEGEACSGQIRMSRTIASNADLVPPRRVLPSSTTAKQADPSTDSGTASPVADSVPPYFPDDASDESRDRVE